MFKHKPSQQTIDNTQTTNSNVDHEIPSKMKALIFRYYVVILILFFSQFHVNRIGCLFVFKYNAFSDMASQQVTSDDDRAMSLTGMRNLKAIFDLFTLK